MQVGDLVKHRRDGTLGVITKVGREMIGKVHYTVDFVDGKRGHCLGRNLVVIKNKLFS